MMMEISTFLHNYEFIGSVPMTVKGHSLRVNAFLPLKQLSQGNLKENIVDSSSPVPLYKQFPNSTTSIFM